MKPFPIILFFLGVSFFTASAQKPGLKYNKYTWYEGVIQAREQGKFFFMYISQKNCEYCKELDRTTMTDPGLIKFLNEKFVLARHHVSSAYGRAFALDFHLQTTPALVVQNPKSQKPPLIIYGVKDAKTLMQELTAYISSI